MYLKHVVEAVLAAYNVRVYAARTFVSNVVVNKHAAHLDVQYFGTGQAAGGPLVQTGQKLPLPSGSKR